MARSFRVEHIYFLDESFETEIPNGKFVCPALGQLPSQWRFGQEL